MMAWLVFLFYVLPVGLISLYIFMLTLASWWVQIRDRIFTSCALSNSYQTMIKQNGASASEIVGLDHTHLRTQNKDTKLPSVLCLIPAHNEEAGIGITLASIADDAQAYAMSVQIQTIVIADNCSDHTAHKARDAGAFVVERFQAHAKGKGQALDWFIKKHKEVVQQHDFITIIDADSIIEKGYFVAMLAALHKPHVHSAQAFYDVLNPQAHWRTMILSIALRALHHTRALGRTFLGGSAGLNGNGMMFRKEILLEYGWPAHSIAEDTEFALILAYNGMKVHYVPCAKVYGYMPDKKDDASEQRARWENGHWILCKIWLLPCLQSFIRKPSRLAFDTILQLAIPPLSLVLILQCFFIFLALLLYNTSLFWAFFPIMCTALYVMSAMIQTKAPLALWRALFSAPCYVVWKIWIYLTKIGRDTKVWKRSARQKNEVEHE